jgi:hypothetical protein
MRSPARFPSVYREVLLPTGLFLLFVLLVLFAGCSDGADPQGAAVDHTAPAPPSGLRSTTGDGFVTLTWRPNAESDLDAYNVYYSFDDLTFHLTATTADTNYVDMDVRNGDTYYYAVTAFDIYGNESELSRESVLDTPRPAGYDVQLVDNGSDPARSAFSFRLGLSGEDGVTSSSDSRADFYFQIDPGDGSRLFYGGNTLARDTWVIDVGTTTSLADVDRAPSVSDPGWVLNGPLSLILHHTYVLQTEEGNYAQVRVTNLVDEYMIFDWGYQLDPYNPELAPTLITEAPTD